jgi:hypothetical protein
MPKDTTPGRPAKPHPDYPPRDVYTAIRAMRVSQKEFAELAGASERHFYDVMGSAEPMTDRNARLSTGCRGQAWRLSVVVSVVVMIRRSLDCGKSPVNHRAGL